MIDIPPEMMARDRPLDPVFADEEVLYRRFRPEDFDGGEVAPEAFELPDMSVNRDKHGPASWLLLDEDFQDWGVASFRVQDIPRDRAVLHAGVIAYVLRPEQTCAAEVQLPARRSEDFPGSSPHLPEQSELAPS